MTDLWWIYFFINHDQWERFRRPFQAGKTTEKAIEKIAVTRTCQIRVSRSWRSSTKIERGRLFLGSTMRAQEAIGRFRSVDWTGWLRDLPKWRWKSLLSEEEFRVVPIARNGGLAVTILRTAGRYTDGMRDVLACVVYYVSATKDALLSRSRRA